MPKQDSVPVQSEVDGYGPHFIRRYQVEIRSPTVSASELMSMLKGDFNKFSPQQNACFRKRKGEPQQLCVGDEFEIDISGLGAAAVRVTRSEEKDFSFQTLEGHPEAGEISFSIAQDSTSIVFRIESRARSKDMIVHLMYHNLGMGKQKQGETWTHFCNAVAESASGEKGEVTVTTYRFEDGDMGSGTFEEIAETVDEVRLDKLKEQDETKRIDSK